MTRGELLEKANSLPLAPGVYLMHAKDGTVIYVGKAKKLKNRVSQYFQAGRGHNLKTHIMVDQVDDFETIIVGSEFEALVLENALIKQHMPRYNILLKDDKGYPFVRLSREAYPRFTMVSRVQSDGARYFGPYGGRFETRAALDAIAGALRLPACRKKFPRDIGKERPCLNYHMGRCDGFCRPEMTAEEYNRRMDMAVKILEGRTKLVTAELERDMEQAAEELRFEEAAALRDRIQAIQVLGKRQKVIAAVCADTDVWGMYLESKCCYAVLHYQEGQLTGREAELFAASALDDPGEILSALLLQYYGGRSVLPREICIPVAIEDQEVLEQLLAEKAGHKVALRVPQRGERAQVLAMAADNAREEAERQTTQAERADKTLELLGRMMDLEEPPEWLESYDISNTGSDDIVASMVVFENGRPLKRDYRHFKLKDMDGPDDYASMEQVLTRRFRRYLDGDEKFNTKPDLLLIDGGENHVRVAQRVLEAMNLDIPAFGMVKDDRHRTRALVAPDGREIGIQAIPAVFALIGQIQEETHRFAIEFNRQQRKGRVQGSTLDKIPGVGEVRRAQLLKHFKSVKAVRGAPLEELERVVPKNTAQAVYHYFREN